uniref:Zinc finger, CCHC-type n=1 Tax=Tanacetum cinerariifolium TaxID=118510 RepID=A0A6L2KD12_TANCI|nr:zinc finger, CCHC-type [Tanacetum cinerariifolium]
MIAKAPDQYGFYIDAEEHELKDHNEPTNYKAALLDPESKKWVEAMNAKMQSMKDNQVWEIWLAIERLQQGESTNKQDVKTKLFWEFGQTDQNAEDPKDEYVMLASLVANFKLDLDENKKSQSFANPLYLKKAQFDPSENHCLVDKLTRSHTMLLGLDVVYREPFPLCRLYLESLDLQN